MRTATRRRSPAFGGWSGGSDYPVHLFTQYMTQALAGTDNETFPNAVDHGKVGGSDGSWGLGSRTLQQMQEAQRKAEEEAQRQAEEEAQRQAEEEARRQQELQQQQEQQQQEQQGQNPETPSDGSGSTDESDGSEGEGKRHEQRFQTAIAGAAGCRHVPYRTLIWHLHIRGCASTIPRVHTDL